jgi:O-antigen/teichoic acid export membrane protein
MTSNTLFDIWIKLLNKLRGFFRYSSILKLMNILLVAAIIVSSGYALSMFVDTLYRVLSAFIVLIISVIVYALNFNIGFINELKTTKKIPYVLPSLIVLIVLGASACLTMLLNHDQANVLGYGVYACMILSAFFVVRAYSFDVFLTCFRKTIFFLSLISLFFYLSHKIAGFDFGLTNFDNSRGSTFSNYFFLCFQIIGLDRIQSVFWEPGLFSSFLLLSMFFEITCEKKIKYYRLVVLFVSLILTMSTFAYLALFVILLTFIDKFLKIKAQRLLLLLSGLLFALLVIVFYDSIISFLVNLLPSVFSKLQSLNSSLTTRMLSPQINFEIFLRSPFFGLGFKGADDLYYSLINESDYASLVDAQTSTSAYYLAVFGILGFVYTLSFIVGIVSNRKANFLQKTTLLILFIVMLNKEPHNTILVTWIFMFFFLKEGLDSRVVEHKLKDSATPNITLISVLKKNGPTQLLVRNVVYTVVLKGMAIVIGFFAVRIYSNYFESDEAYGVWLAILSILGWIMTFDLGLGNGMKNKLIESFEKKDNEKSKQIISSTYISSIIISLGIFVVGAIIVFSVNLNAIFGISSDIINAITLKITALITLFGISLEFTLKNITYIFHSMQKQLYANMLPLISSVLIVLFTLLIKPNGYSPQLIWVSVAYAVFHNITYLVASVYFFAKPLKLVRPNVKSFSSRVVKDVMSLGITFFAIQLVLLLINGTDQILISNIYGPSFVVIYTKYIKIFSVISSIFSIMCLTLWASIKQSFERGKIEWIKKTQKKFMIIALVFSVVLLLFVAFFQTFLDLWLSESTIDANYLYAFICAAQAIVSFYVSIITAVSNGVQTLKTQSICFTISAVIKITLSYFITALFPQSDWIVIVLITTLCVVPVLVALPAANSRKMKEKITSLEGGGIIV